MFPSIPAPPGAWIEGLPKDLSEIVRPMVALDALRAWLRATHDPKERSAWGVGRNITANDPFAFYRNHKNREERELCAVRWQRFTDEELRAMRREIVGAGRPEMIPAIWAGPFPLSDSASS
jgi:hypothetical protein